MKKHVLIVDDDPTILAMVSFLAHEGGDVRISQVETGQGMLNVLNKDTIDLLILDLGLPDEDGLALARQVRARSDVQIMVLTGDESKESRIAALEIGVNEFLTKPFDPYELQLRIKNQLRYNRPGPENKRVDSEKPLRFEGYVLDPAKRSLETEKGERVHLTNSEFTILSALIRRQNMALSRNMILDAIVKSDEAPSDRAVDAYIAQIRAKIEINPKKPRLISTVRGYGYIFSAKVS